MQTAETQLLQKLPPGVVIGASFSPERFRDDQAQARQAFSWLVNTLGLREVRLGLRWDKLEAEPFKINLDYYRWFLDYALQNQVNICLNIGPIKVFGWPEEHLPHFLKDQFRDRKYSYQKIKNHHDLAKRAKDYYQHLVQRLVSEYGQNFLAIQVENEPFNPMGEKRLIFGFDYLLDLAKVTTETFPLAKILLNSNNRFNLGSIIQFINFAHTHGLNYNKFLVGYDYYYKTIYTEKIPIYKKTDPMAVSLPGHLSTKNFLQKANKLGFDTEVTEVQFEPWGDDQTPGNSLDDFIYTITRTSTLFNPGQQTKVIRLWGAEPFASKFLSSTFTDQHRRIAALIYEINLLSIG